MKKMLGMAGYALLLFGMTAGIGWLMKSKTADATSAEETAEQEPQPLDMTQLPRPSDSAGPQPTRTLDQPGGESAEDDEALPVAVRPEIMTVEEIVRYGMGLKERDLAIRQREDALRRIEGQHRLVLADMQAEQKEVEGLLVQVRDQRMAVEELLKRTVEGQNKIKADKETLATELEKLTAEKSKIIADRERMLAEMKNANTDASTISAVMDNEDRKSNAKRMAVVAAGMAPEAAANMLSSLANDGSMEDAAEILANLEDRKSSAVLEEIQKSDEGLMKELVNLLLSRKTPTKSARNR
ncbi:MAG: hypothetical protein KDA85_07005 [Planctomycetaceae bacterium]|nr:hypothetical protein [Planctomycetaceae bacterium]